MMNTNAASDDSEQDSFGELNSFQDFDNPENASASFGQGALDDTTPAASAPSASNIPPQELPDEETHPAAGQPWQKAEEPENAQTLRVNTPREGENQTAAEPEQTHSETSKKTQPIYITQPDTALPRLVEEIAKFEKKRAPRGQNHPFQRKPARYTFPGAWSSRFLRENPTKISG